MAMVKKIVLLLSVMTFNIIAKGQDEKTTVGMADLLRSNGKIYVVVAVILTIFAGIIFYIIRLDKKISRLEKNQL